MSEFKPLVTHAHCGEYELHKYSAFASDLRFPVAHVPSKLMTDMGNGQDFWLQRKTEDKFVYMQAYGCIELTVFND